VIGPVLVLIAIVVAIPVAVLMSGAALSWVLGFFLQSAPEGQSDQRG
jgi:hypothetical protein